MDPFTRLPSSEHAEAVEFSSRPSTPNMTHAHERLQALAHRAKERLREFASLQPPATCLNPFTYYGGTDNFWKIHTELGEHEVVGILLALAALIDRDLAAFEATATQLRGG